MDHCVAVVDLLKRFGSFTAIDHLNFQIDSGEVFGLLGPNGCGKSTTVRILCGLLRPTGGSVHVAGVDVAELSSQVRRKIGYMSQKFSLYCDLTVIENLRFYGGLYRLTGRMLTDRIDCVLAMFGLSEWKDYAAGTLAHGWKQRLSLGCAVLHQPSVLFLDEPTAGVDPVGRRSFWAIIRDLTSDGVTILLTTHHMDEAEHCNRLAVMNSGRLMALGTPTELAAAFDGTVLIVDADPLETALQVIRTRAGNLSVMAFENALRLTVGKTSDEVKALLKILEIHGVTLKGVRSVDPMLEDVFVHLTNNAGQTSNSPSVDNLL